MNAFDGKKINELMMKKLANKVVGLDRPPVLAEFLIGDDPVSRKYVELKQKFAHSIGVQFCLYKFEEKDSEEQIIEAIEFLNTDPETDGILIQIPAPKKFDRDKLISAISPKKDVDGLRYCLGLTSDFKPPVVLSVLEAIKRSKADLQTSNVVVVGSGFLVGAPLIRVLKEKKINLTIADNETKNFEDVIGQADIIISATGVANLIKADIVKENVVLIDAGTAEQNGALVGDIDSNAYAKSSYHTPVPGGIGPTTIAMLFQNLVQK
ncbi:MAG: bifunctional 5,10-methylenetetrahydrofolate dehydrogenase/5,10-methenyltetrahydrofolate cyclohydrolase [bacterium]